MTQPVEIPAEAVADEPTAPAARPPRPRNAERTRARILAAALRDFSARGINGARVDAIALRAGTNKRMLYYYFGSKDGLFRAVLRHRLTEQAPPAAQRDRTSAGRIANLQDRMADSRDYVRLLMWEALERSDRAAIENEDLRRAAFDDWVAAIETAQRDGTIPADLDARQLVLSELALAIFPFAFPQLTRLVTDRSPSDPAFKAERRTFLERLGAHLTHREA
ncbi:MAG TPA: TetR family transcriptional regulator [Acidimicrobiia bacterium]|nr:TetR family transcriptional regulator [Acidimicrobiia bacterium]